MPAGLSLSWGRRWRVRVAYAGRDRVFMVMMATGVNVDNFVNGAEASSSQEAGRARRSMV